MTVAQHVQYSIAEFVHLEEMSPTKHEFLDGVVYAMGGGTPEHGLRAANMIFLLRGHLEGRPCHVYTSDVRVRVGATGLDTYPDVSVVCDRVEHDPEDSLAIANPRLLVEVLSPRTEAYDRGDKLRHYKQITSLQEVLFVCHDRTRLEVWRRVDERWEHHQAQASESLHLQSLDFDLRVDDVYKDPLAPPGTS